MRRAWETPCLAQFGLGSAIQLIKSLNSARYHKYITSFKKKKKNLQTSLYNLNK